MHPNAASSKGASAVAASFTTTRAAPFACRERKELLRYPDSLVQRMATLTKLYELQRLQFDVRDAPYSVPQSEQRCPGANQVLLESCGCLGNRQHPPVRGYRRFNNPLLVPVVLL